MILLEMIEEMEKTPALFHCSHRKQGNSNNAVNLFQRGMQQAGGPEGSILYMRKLDIKPCTACGICAKDPKSPCILEKKDFTRNLFEYMFKMPFLFIAAPIYFYHLPSRFKTLIDRSQWVWARQQKGDPEIVNLPKRPAYVCLFAGHEKGDKLFEGSLLTLKYFLQSFNFEIKEALTFPGKEKIADLERDKEAADKIRDLGRMAWENHQQSQG